jgi:uncharacterized membrane protein
MTKNRLEAFSDGVIAIIITIMALELKVPRDPSPVALLELAPVMLSYVLSYIYIGIYWNNHHHMFHAVRHVSGGVLWANLHLLFWLSLVPFVTGWMGENHFALWPVLAYGVVLLCAALAYTILVRTLIAVNGRDSALAKAIGADVKGDVSLAIYVASIAAAFLHPLLACAGFVIVAVIWLVPDRRIERTLSDGE